LHNTFICALALYTRRILKISLRCTRAKPT
jgi:hypothetical protein